MRVPLPRRPVADLGRAGAISAAAGLLLIFAATPATAHTDLISADPADDSTVATAPSKVTLTFDERIRAPSVIIVTGPSGARVQRGGTRVIHASATTQVEVTAPGRYRIAYRIAGADGHPVTGQTTFTYQPRGSPGAGARRAESTAPTTGAVGEPGQHHDEQSGAGSGWLIRGIAGLALLGGFALLVTSRRGLDWLSRAAREDRA